MATTQRSGTGVPSEHGRALNSQARDKTPITGTPAAKASVGPRIATYRSVACCNWVRPRQGDLEHQHHQFTVMDLADQPAVSLLDRSGVQLAAA